MECEREIFLKMHPTTCKFKVFISLHCEFRHKVLKSFIPCKCSGAASLHFGSESDCSTAIECAPSLEPEEACSAKCGYKAKRVLSIESTATQNRFLCYCLTKRKGDVNR